MSLTVALMNGLLGAICGVRFRIQIFIPLIAVALVEAVLLKLTGVGWPVFWSATVLICSLEVGYLVGSTAGTLLAHFKPPKLSTAFHAREHGRLSHH